MAARYDFLKKGVSIDKKKHNSMERRDALKALAVLTGGAVLVPSCNFLKEDILAAYKNLQVTPSLQQMLAQVTSTIIPAGTLKGAADLQVQDFILVMVNDCFKPGEQQLFMRGMQHFDDYSDAVGGKSFKRLTPEAQTQVVEAGLAIEPKEAPATETEEEKEARENEQAVREFLQITKRFTIQGFMMSQYIMTEIKPYKMLPGDYQGAVLLSDLKPEVIHG